MKQKLFDYIMLLMEVMLAGSLYYIWTLYDKTWAIFGLILLIWLVGSFGLLIVWLVYSYDPPEYD